MNGHGCGSALWSMTCSLVTRGQLSTSQHPPTGNSSLCSQDSGVNPEPFIRFVSSWGVETKYSFWSKPICSLLDRVQHCFGQNMEARIRGFPSATSFRRCLVTESKAHCLLSPVFCPVKQRADARKHPMRCC